MKPLHWKCFPGIEANVLRRSGEVCIEGTRLPVSCLSGPFFAGDSVEAVAANYHATVEQVETAIRYAMHPRRKAFEAAALKRWKAYARNPKAWWKLPAPLGVDFDGPAVAVSESGRAVVS